jgi:acyl-coenzyme A synthetase/AMP-(fatty) acid ligase
MSLIALSQLMVDGRADSDPVALRQNQVVNFSQFRSDVAKITAKFRSIKKATLLCRDSYHFAVGFFGLLQVGAEIVLPSRLQSSEIQDIACDALIDDLRVERGVAEGDASNVALLHVLDPHSKSLVFYTSGSTGAPKAIAKNLAMFEREIEVLDHTWGDSAAQGPVLATVPHQHVYGLTFGVLWPLMAGRAFMSEPYALWETLVADLTSGNTIVSSPAHLERLDGIMLPSSKGPPLRIFSAGAPLSFEASRQTKNIFGCLPNEIFGSTETGAFATRCQIDADAPWHPLSGVNLRIDENGQLMLRSPFLGPDWLTTADLVEPNNTGFRFLGRADRIAKIEGKRIHLAEVEQALMQLPFVASCRVSLIV